MTEDGMEQIREGQVDDRARPSWEDPELQAPAGEPATGVLGVGSVSAPASVDGHVGVVHDLRTRVEKRWRLPGEQVVSFRLERWDQRAGDELPPLSVEMRGFFLSGGVLAGEQVIVSGRLRGGTLVAARVVSRTTGGAMSTRLRDWIEMRVGRRGLATAVLLVLSAVVLVVRFTPYCYAQTPMGLGDYRHVVGNTCLQVQDIRRQATLTDVTFSTTDGGAAPQLLYDRNELSTVLRHVHAATVESLDGLLARPAPLLVRDQRRRLADLMPQLRAVDAQTERLVDALPPKVSLVQAKQADLEGGPAVDQVDLELTGALAALSGQPCSFSSGTR